LIRRLRMRYIGLDLAIATVHKAVVIDEQG